MSARAAATIFLFLLQLFGATAAAGREILPLECTVPDAAFADVREPFDLAMERSGEAVLIRFDPSGTTHTHQLLRMPGCNTVPLVGGPLPSGLHPMSVRPGGARLVAAARAPDGRPEWWYSPDTATPLAQVSPVTAGRVAGQPILSEDGRWAAWVQRKPGTGRQTCHARELLGTGVRSGDTAALGAGSYEALGFDQGKEIMTFVRDLSEIIEFDTRSGQLSGPALRPPDVASQPGTFQRFRSGWFAWDAYREDTPWRAVWFSGGRTGRYDVDWSKMIVSYRASLGTPAVVEAPPPAGISVPVFIARERFRVEPDRPPAPGAGTARPPRSGRAGRGPWPRWCAPGRTAA